MGCWSSRQAVAAEKSTQHAGEEWTDKGTVVEDKSVSKTGGE